ncbi:Heparan-alpha-glucosaminide N-acetyltransferase [Glycine max]|nr:Heparan-alpha-glucosaminide N-acetyltransferase [Glycine max]
MDEAKRMEEGLKTTYNDYHKGELKHEIERTNGNGDSIEHDKDARITQEGESVQQIVEQEQPLLMVLVDDADAGGAYPRIDHSPWNGCTLADFVMPFFLFIVGVAIALALKRIPKVKYAVKNIILRTLKLLFWGILLQGGYSHAPDDLSYGIDMRFIRWCGILQRIALVYCAKHTPPSLDPYLEARTPIHFHSLSMAMFISNVDYMKTLYTYSISASLSGTIGIHYGHVLIHFKGRSERLKQWLLMGFSYVCFTAGAAGIVFSIDVWGIRTPFLFLEWIGMNAMLVFVMAAQGIFAAFVNGWYYKDPDNTIVYWIQNHVFTNVWHSERLGTLLYVIFAEITFWGVVSGILHKLGIYWKL